MSELIRHFGIDWKLLLAQAVNFLILLFILKRYAYKPVLEMLNKRRREIEKGLEFTRSAEEKLKHISIEREEKLQEAREEALMIISTAEESSKKRKDKILNETNKKVETIVADARRLIEEKQKKSGEEILREAEGLVRLGIARVLGKKPAEERDRELIQEALNELKTL